MTSSGPSWNPVLNLFLEMKDTFATEFGEDGLWDYDLYETDCLTYWAERLGRDDWLDLLRPLILNEHDSLLLVRYDRVPALPDGQDFWQLHDGLYQECRSVVIDTRRAELALTPFRKFRNVGECEETSLENVRRRVREGMVVELSDKLDGSMQSARWYQGRPLLAGSKALDPKASFRVREGYQIVERPEYRAMLAANPELTFVFELISPNDRHVVVYGEEDYGLHLVGLRDVRDGRELPYAEVRATAARFGVPTCEVFDKTLEEALASLDDKAAAEAEGFVLNADGWKVKLKYNDYVAMHRTISALSSPNFVVRAVADGTDDDLLAKLPGAYRQMAEASVTKVRVYQMLLTAEIEDWEARLRARGFSERKDAMVWITKEVPQRLQKYLRMGWLGQSYDLLRQQSGRYLTMKEIDEYLSGRWDPDA